MTKQSEEFSTPRALVVSLICVEDDLQRFSQRLAARVNQGRMYLTRVLATGTQVYPVRVDSLRGTAALLQCEFRMRNSVAPVGDDEASELLRQMEGYQVLEVRLVDDSGVHVSSPHELQVAS